MPKRRVKDYREPWTTTKDMTWESIFRFPPVESQYFDADAVAKWHADRANAEARAHWFVWGSRTSPPAIVEDYMGRMKVWEGKGIIGWSRNMPEGVDHEEMAKRVCECVNACQAIADPVKLIEDVRALLLDIVQGQTGPEDPRILSSLSRLIPANELQALNAQYGNLNDTED